MFKRFMDLVGNVTALRREIASLPYLFPAFDKDIDEEIVNSCALMKVFGGDGTTLIGYTVSSDRGVRNILTNPIYAGMWVYEGMLIDSENHSPIVDLGTFLYAYNRLSSTNLDGTPNEEFLRRKGRYTKKHKADRSAILKNHIEAADPQYNIRVKEVPQRSKESQAVRPFYTFILRHSIGEQKKYSVLANDVDTFFLQILKGHLEESGDFEDLLDEESAELAAQLQLQEDIERGINAVNSLMSRIET